MYCDLIQYSIVKYSSVLWVQRSYLRACACACKCTLRTPSSAKQSGEEGAAHPMALSAAEEFPGEVAEKDSSPPPFHIASLLSTSPAAEKKRRGANRVSSGSPPSDWPLAYTSTGEFAAECTVEQC